MQRAGIRLLLTSRLTVTGWWCVVSAICLMDGRLLVVDWFSSKLTRSIVLRVHHTLHIILNCLLSPILSWRKIDFVSQLLSATVNEDGYELSLTVNFALRGNDSAARDDTSLGALPTGTYRDNQTLRSGRRSSLTRYASQESLGEWRLCWPYQLLICNWDEWRFNSKLFTGFTI